MEGLWVAVFTCVISEATQEIMAIYIVEDDAAVSDGLSLLLEQNGHNVSNYSSAEIFLEEKYFATDSIILLDHSLPGRSGLDLQAELIKRGIALPIIFITGCLDEQICVEATKAGAVSLLNKPFKNEDLLESVRDAFSRV